VTDVHDFNAKLIDEYRATGGKPSGPFEGAPLLLLTTTGAKSGQARTSPVVYAKDGDDLIVFGSYAGADRHPDWYHNLVANPQVGVELGGESFEADAVVTEGEERDRLFAAQVAAMPPFAEYEKKTSRRIPVVRLRRR
jgi:deazaflavin-dependent oxidoreductase (nitroreductase family)